MSGLNQKRRMNRQALFTSQTALNKYVGGFWCEKTTWMDFFTWGYNGLWTFLLSRMMDLFLTNLHFTRPIGWTGMCGLHVDDCDVCISCLDSHFDGTHSLQRIHWWVSYISPNIFQCRNKLIYILDALRVSKVSANFHFQLSYSSGNTRTRITQNKQSRLCPEKHTLL